MNNTTSHSSFDWRKIMLFFSFFDHAFMRKIGRREKLNIALLKTNLKIVFSAKFQFGKMYDLFARL